MREGGEEKEGEREGGRERGGGREREGKKDGQSVRQTESISVSIYFHQSAFPSSFGLHHKQRKNMTAGVVGSVSVSENHFT